MGKGDRLASKGDRRLLALAAAGLTAAAILGWAILTQVNAAGTVVVRVQNYAAPAFTPVEESTHNNNGDSVCPAFVPSQQGSENRGDLNAKKGSFLVDVQLPQGATVTQVALFANDNDGDTDAHVYLVRKRIEQGLSPQFTGYAVMASPHSQGAVLNTMRKFRDSSIVGARIDNTRFYYFLELVNCGVIEPFAAQISFTT